MSRPGRRTVRHRSSENNAVIQVNYTAGPTNSSFQGSPCSSTPFLHAPAHLPIASRQRFFVGARLATVDFFTEDLWMRRPRLILDCYVGISSLAIGFIYRAAPRPATACRFS